MILSCNSCEKKFVVPDKAITESGRLVQCGACGNQWKQFPIKNKIQENTLKINSQPTKPSKVTKTKKRKTKRDSGPNLYSPEYLEKKHGIKLNDKTSRISKKSISKSSVNFGFYNFLIISIVISILLFRTLYFAQDAINDRFPIFEVYLDYSFETISNIKVIIENFFSNY